MFSQIKIYLGLAVTAVIGVLFTLLKIKSSQLDVAKERLKAKAKEAKAQKIEKKIAETARVEFREDVAKIEKTYEEIQRKVIEGMDDKPLSNELLNLLHQRRNKNTGDKAP